MNDLTKRILQYALIMGLVVMSVLMQGCQNPRDEGFDPYYASSDYQIARHLIWRLEKIEAKIDALAEAR